jgi:N-acetylmuramoyl-L-alanine amidase
VSRSFGILSVLLVLAAAAAVSVAGAAAADARSIDGVRMHEAPGYTRVVFDVSGPVRYQLFTLESPHRVVIDVGDARPRPGFDPARAGSTGQVTALGGVLDGG